MKFKQNIGRVKCIKHRESCTLAPNLISPMTRTTIWTCISCTYGLSTCHQGILSPSLPQKRFKTYILHLKSFRGLNIQYKMMKYWYKKIAIYIYQRGCGAVVGRCYCWVVSYRFESWGEPNFCKWRLIVLEAAGLPT